MTSFPPSLAPCPLSLSRSIVDKWPLLRSRTAALGSGHHAPRLEPNAAIDRRGAHRPAALSAAVRVLLLGQCGPIPLRDLLQRQARPTQVRAHCAKAHPIERPPTPYGAYTEPRPSPPRSPSHRPRRPCDGVRVLPFVPALLPFVLRLRLSCKSLCVYPAPLGSSMSIMRAPSVTG